MYRHQLANNYSLALQRDNLSNNRRRYHEGTGSTIVEEQSAYNSYSWPLPAVRKFGHQSNSATTGMSVIVIKVQAEALKSLVAAHYESVSPASVLINARDAFGLNISETAEIFGITRQTAYQWMKFTEMDQVRSHDNRTRIRDVYSAVQSWQSRPKLKGRWLNSLLPSGKTVLDILKGSPIDLNGLENAYNILSASKDDRQRMEGELATKAMAALEDSFKGLGSGRKIRKVSN